jgi:hypothetical protein
MSQNCHKHAARLHLACCQGPCRNAQHQAAPLHLFSKVTLACMRSWSQQKYCVFSGQLSASIVNAVASSL